MNEMKIPLALAVQIAERTVARLTERVRRYADAVESHTADVRAKLNSGDLRGLNDLGELQQSATGFEAAVGALYAAQEALDLLRQVEK